MLGDYLCPICHRWHYSEMLCVPTAPEIHPKPPTTMPTDKPKIIQIAINPDGDTCYPCLYALRDDGTIWATALVVPGNQSERLGVWSQLTPIP